MHETMCDIKYWTLTMCFYFHSIVSDSHCLPKSLAKCFRSGWAERKQVAQGYPTGFVPKVGIEFRPLVSSLLPSQLHQTGSQVFSFSSKWHFMWRKPGTLDMTTNTHENVQLFNHHLWNSYTAWVKFFTAISLLLWSLFSSNSYKVKEEVLRGGSLTFPILFTWPQNSKFL